MFVFLPLHFIPLIYFYILSLLLKINWLYMHGFILGPLVCCYDLYRFIFTKMPCYFDYYVFILKSGNFRAATFFFYKMLQDYFFKISLHFHIHYYKNNSRFMEKLPYQWHLKLHIQTRLLWASQAQKISWQFQWEVSHVYWDMRIVHTGK